MRQWAAGLGVALVSAGCGLFFRAPTPVATVRYSSTAAAGNLLVLLPGRGDRARSFADAGIVDIARRSVPRMDLISVDATLGYYIHRNLIERLQADVIEPARAGGYRSIWLAGISMGGLGSALYAEKHAKEVAGIVLIAPFLGDPEVLAEIEAAGGLRAWQPPSIDPDDYQRGLWRWLKACTSQQGSCPRIFLGFGSNDRFVRAHRLLAAVLPPNQVVEVPGGHDWEPWRALFAALLPKLVARSEPG
jgi:pimeloyl-ACP methyl ester carboxylesterase